MVDRTMPRESSAGFSLVETLVALSVLSLLSVVLLGALQQIQPLRQATRDMGVRAELNVLADFLEETISAASLLARVDENPDKRIAFEGDETRLLFVGPLRIGSERLGLRELAITLAPRGATGELWIDSWLRRAKRGKTTRSLIADDLSFVRFEYLTENVPPGRATWKHEWASDILPVAVKATIRKASANGTLEVQRTIFLKNAVRWPTTLAS
ncbi:hypothetical protein N185_15815 [Sinorhizobium sp. GW3]|nr:hypothetical protein N185_15815 [Sinorhizobium sp. GW3]